MLALQQTTINALEEKLTISLVVVEAVINITENQLLAREKLCVTQAKAVTQGVSTCCSSMITHSVDILRSIPTQTTLFQSGRMPISAELREVTKSKPYFCCV